LIQEDLFTSDNVKVKGKDYDLAWKRLAVAIGEENMTVTNAAIAVKSSSVEYYKSDQSNIKTGALNQCSDLPWPSATLDVCHWRDLLHNPSCGWVLGSRGWWTFIVLGISKVVFFLFYVYVYVYVLFYFRWHFPCGIHYYRCVHKHALFDISSQETPQ